MDEDSTTGAAAPADQVIDATFGLLAERLFDRISLHDIADRAGMSLADLARTFPTRGHILDAWSRKIDAEVLSADTSDMADQSGRDRLFDILMSRIDALRPYRLGVAGLMRSVRSNGALALAMNALAVRSHTWMLAAAGIEATGSRGPLVAQGMAVSFARVLRVFVGEDDPGLPRTMAALDRELRAAEARHNRLARFFGPSVRDRMAATNLGAGGKADPGWPVATEPFATDAADSGSTTAFGAATDAVAGSASGAATGATVAGSASGVATGATVAGSASGANTGATVAGGPGPAGSADAGGATTAEESPAMAGAPAIDASIAAFQPSYAGLPDGRGGTSEGAGASFGKPSVPNDLLTVTDDAAQGPAQGGSGSAATVSDELGTPDDTSSDVLSFGGDVPGVGSDDPGLRPDTSPRFGSSDDAVGGNVDADGSLPLPDGAPAARPDEPGTP